MTVMPVLVIPVPARIAKLAAVPRGTTLATAACALLTRARTSTEENKAIHIVLARAQPRTHNFPIFTTVFPSSPVSQALSPVSEAFLHLSEEMAPI
jgi:hypothetical protein